MADNARPQATASRLKRNAARPLPKKLQTAHSPCRSCFSCESGQRPPHKQKHRAGVESPADKTQTYNLALTNRTNHSPEKAPWRICTEQAKTPQKKLHIVFLWRT
jgi:hypothetical protein